MRSPWSLPQEPFSNPVHVATADWRHAYVGGALIPLRTSLTGFAFCRCCSTVCSKDFVAAIMSDASETTLSTAAPLHGHHARTSAAWGQCLRVSAVFRRGAAAYADASERKKT